MWDVFYFPIRWHLLSKKYTVQGKVKHMILLELMYDLSFHHSIFVMPSFYLQCIWNLCMISLSISNTLFREFSLISMRRVPELPAGPHKLLAILAEPLKQKENLISLEDPEVSDNLQEFEDWVCHLLLILMCIFSLCK